MDHSGNVIATKGALKVIDCVKCGYAHLDPLPDARKVGQYYIHNYYTTDLWWCKELSEHTHGLWNTAYQFQSHLLGVTPMVDWGCGAGFFPMWWRQNIDRYHSYGIEPSDCARSYFGLDYILPDASMLPDKVTYNHRASLVFEHVVNPRALLIQMKSILWKKVLIIVPHDGPTNPLQVKLGGNFWIDKNHLNYWSPQGLTNLLEGVGLRVTYRGATFPIELCALLTGKDYRNDEVWGKKCHLFRLRFEKSLGPMAFRLYGLWHRKLLWGRELLYVAEG